MTTFLTELADLTECKQRGTKVKEAGMTPEQMAERMELLEVVVEASRDFHCNYAGGCGCDICEAFLQLDAFDRRAALTPKP